MGVKDISLCCQLVLLFPSTYYNENVSFINVYPYGLSLSIECQGFVFSGLTSGLLMLNDEGVPQAKCWRVSCEKDRSLPG